MFYKILHGFKEQVSRQEEGERETHPSVYCTALIWGREGDAPPDGRPPRPREGGREGGRDRETPLD
ncbi:unnamed protein product [Menidia menidia]|uniref:(Atlantic silverside) hypothetical protein n=1 Tax=Menidia menidia TaxID=238744 RepID=A0A8S4B4F6_9TELE|nr:unnamed protein product [Menidia menidia]